jgi:hypothetical protein
LKLYEVSNQRLAGKPLPLPFLDQVFEIKSDDGAYSDEQQKKKYFILKEVSKDELPEEPKENAAEPSGVFIVPNEEAFDYYKAAALSKSKSEQNQKFDLHVISSAPPKAKEPPKANNLKTVESFTKQNADYELSKQIYQDIIDSYKAAAIEEKTNRPSLGANHEDELLPPPFGQSEKNYYLEKVSKKTKKYDASVNAAKEKFGNEEAQPDVFHHEQENEREEEEEDQIEEGNDEGIALSNLNKKLFNPFLYFQEMIQKTKILRLKRKSLYSRPAK